MFNKNKIILLLVLTFFFSFLIFIAKNYFFGGFETYENKIIEENYIEPQAMDIDQEIIANIEDADNAKINQEDLDKKIEEKVLETLNSAYKLKYSFFPSDFIEEEEAKNYYDLIDAFLNSDNIINKISFLDIYVFKDKGVVRGKMADKKIKLFGIYEMEKSEFLSVGVHEFAHFLDLYFLEKKVSKDISDYFYDISWESTTVIKPGQEQKDFVSGYSMTNKYEDFAESFTYYILHNSDFLQKSKDSDILLEKYKFFEKYIFRNNEFKTDFYKSNEEIKDYYRDITKIDFSLEKFLQYLKK